jgi:hypothetical protein
MNPAETLLTREDGLRLNVLMTQAEAVRIDPRGPTVVALAGGRELRVELHPQGREDAYLLAVRRLLASLVIGHPGGFPVFIRRWLRGGQLENLRSADLLKLGEPEAVLAAAAAPGVDEALARRAWWAHPEAAVARALLANPALTAAGLRRELAAWLVEQLPFEQDEGAVMATVRLIAAPGLLPPQARLRLWRRGSQRLACRVGFLQAAPDDLPEPRPARVLAAADAAALAGAAAAGNPVAVTLARLLAAPGQSLLAACDVILEDPQHRDIVSPLLNLLGERCCPEGLAVAAADAVGDLQAAAAAQLADPDAPAARLVAAAPELAGEVRALLLLAGSHEALCYPVFARSTASGSLLRDKLAPRLQPLRAAVATLLGGAGVAVAPGRRRRSAATRLPNWG